MGNQATPKVEREGGVEASKARNEVGFEDIDGLLGGVIVQQYEMKGDVAVLEKIMYGLWTLIVDFLYKQLVAADGEKLEKLTISGNEVALCAGFEGRREDCC